MFTVRFKMYLIIVINITSQGAHSNNCRFPVSEFKVICHCMGSFIQLRKKLSLLSLCNIFCMYWCTYVGESTPTSLDLSPNFALFMRINPLLIRTEYNARLINHNKNLIFIEPNEIIDNFAFNGRRVWNLNYDRERSGFLASQRLSILLVYTHTKNSYNVIFCRKVEIILSFK